MKACAYRHCGQSFAPDREDKRLYCSPACRSMEAVRRRKELEPYRPHRPVSRAPRACRLPGCESPVPEFLHGSSRYCGPACLQQARRHRKLATYHRGQQAAASATPPPAAYPDHPDAQPCQGCAHVRLQPESFRGVECAKAIFRSCNPLGFRGPLLKEAV